MKKLQLRLVAHRGDYLSIAKLFKEYKLLGCPDGSHPEDQIKWVKEYLKNFLQGYSYFSKNYKDKDEGNTILMKTSIFVWQAFRHFILKNKLDDRIELRHCLLHPKSKILKFKTGYNLDYIFESFSAQLNKLLYD
jgi:hypothetical protein